MAFSDLVARIDRSMGRGYCWLSVVCRCSGPFVSGVWFAARGMEAPSARACTVVIRSQVFVAVDAAELLVDLDHPGGTRGWCGAPGFRFQPLPIQPCVTFSITRLTFIVHHAQPGSR